MAEFLGLWTFYTAHLMRDESSHFQFHTCELQRYHGFFLFLHIFHPVTVFRRTLPQVQNVVRTPSLLCLLSMTPLCSAKWCRGILHKSASQAPLFLQKPICSRKDPCAVSKQDFSSKTPKSLFLLNKYSRVHLKNKSVYPPCNGLPVLHPISTPTSNWTAQTPWLGSVAVRNSIAHASTRSKTSRGGTVEDTDTCAVNVARLL